MKKQHKHQILPVIYPDRFMHANRSTVEALRKKVAILRRKIAFLKACLKRYENFNKSGMSIDTALSMSLHFFAAQGTGQAPESGLDDAEMNDVEVLLPLQQPPVESAIVQQMLSTYRTKVREQIQCLKQQIENQENLLNSQYSALTN